MPFVSLLPENPTLQDLRSAYADLFDLLRPYAERLMRGPSPFTPAQRELIAAYVSGVNSCRYCHGVHSQVAANYGIELSLFGALMTNIDSASVDEPMKPVLRYVRKLTETPNRMTEADAKAVRDAGWNDEALVHAVAVCAYFNQMNRLVEGSGIVGTVEDYQLAGKRLVDAGYAGAQPSASS